MGILNVTPDSFSDGGRFLDYGHAVTRGLEMTAQGAEILDIGGESTRPGSTAVDEREEISRVIPVIETLAEKTDVLLSVDTVKPMVAKAALSAGARMINDVSNLRDGVALAEVAASGDAYLVLMHSRGTPETMQQMTSYRDVVKEVVEELLSGVERALEGGVARDKIWLDPGLGFAKTAQQNVEIIGRLGEIVALGYPVLVGPSRKSFIGALSGAEVYDRIGGTAAAVTASIMNGASAVRVHDVNIMRQASIIAHAITAERALKRSEEMIHA